MDPRGKMIAFACRQPTDKLCEVLIILDRKPRTSDEEKITRAVIIDVLCARHPEADAAFDTWADTDTTGRGAVEAITAAALAAVRGT